MSARKMTITDIRTILARLLYDWEILACNCVDRKLGGNHAPDCTVRLSHTVRQASKAIARLDEIAQKGL